MKNALGKLFVMAAVSVMTLGVYSESGFSTTLITSYETSIDNPVEDNSYDINILPEDDFDEYRDQ